MTVAVVCALAGAATLVHAPLGTELFGEMDAAWRNAARAANPYCLPDEWRLQDWLQIAVAFAVLLVARFDASHEERVRRLFDAVILVAGAGILVGWIAPRLPYALLFQGQAYRALWLLQLIQIPVLFARLHRFPLQGSISSRALTTLLVAGFAYASMTGWQLLSAAVMLCIMWVWRRAGRGDHKYSVTLKLATGVGIIAVIGPTVVSALDCCRQMAPFLTPLECVQTIPRTIGPFFTWLTAVIGVLLASRLLGWDNRFRCASLAGCLVLQTACFVVPYSPLYAWLDAQRLSDVECVRHFLEERRSRYPGVPTVYWTRGNPADIWLGLRAKSFYLIQQTVGNMFNRGTAMEGERRARIVRDFDLRAWASSQFRVADWKARSLRRIYGSDLDSPAPTLEDLYHLCAENVVDVAVLPYRFDGWFSASNGRWFIYDCRAIELELAEKLAQPGRAAKSPSPVAPSTDGVSRANDPISADSRRCISEARPRKPAVPPRNTH